MYRDYGNAYLEWMKLAEEAARREDYEAAARFFRRVAIYYALINDPANRRIFAAKTAECHVEAAKKSENEGAPLRTILSYVRAVDSFREAGDEKSAQLCDSMVRRYGMSVIKSGSFMIDGESHNLKTLGDYFVRLCDCEIATEFYRAGAERALKEGKSALCAGLYRDIAECYQKLGNLEGAAKSHGMSADMYLNCEKYFEASWHYCESCLLFILAGKLEEASTMAGKAGSSCRQGQIDILLNDLSSVCGLLSKKSLYAAEERWNTIGKKFKKSYVDLVDSCFGALKGGTTS